MMGIRWSKLHKVIRYIGRTIAIPFKLMGFWQWIRPREDVMDVWSFGHALAAALLTSFALGAGASLWLAWLFGNLIMLAYELVVDGLRLEDPRGAQDSDLGYNLVGATMTVVAFWLGSLLRWTL